MNDYSQFLINCIVQAIHQPGCCPVGEFFNGKMLLKRFEITEYSPIFRSRIIDFTDVDFPWPFLIVALIRDGHVIIPKGDTVMEKNDTIYVLLPSESIAEFITFINPAPQKYQRIAVYGSSDLAKNLIEVFCTAKKDAIAIKDVEENKKILKDIFIKSGVATMDVFVAASLNHKENIKSALLAKELGVKMTILVVFSDEDVTPDDARFIDLIISKKDKPSGNLKLQAEPENFFVIKKFFSCDVDILEFVVEKGSLATKALVKDLDFPKDCLLGARTHQDNTFLIKGNTRLYPSDRVIIFSHKVDEKKLQAFFVRQRLFRKAF